MNLSTFEVKKVFFAQLFILGFVFFIPLSVSLKTVFLVAALFLILITPSLNQNLWFACTSLWGRMALILFGFILIACLWSPAPYSYQALALGKYLKLLYLPILAVGFMNPQMRRSAINVYLLAMVLTSLASIIKSLGYFTATEPGTLAYNYIITGFMMALASYFAGIYFSKSKSWWRILYSIVFFLTSYQVLFINKGRTGYLIYFVLMCFLLVQSFSFKKALVALTVFCSVFGVVYSLSGTMQFRVHAFANEIRSLQNKQKDTSLGYRVQFHYYSKTLFKENTWIGLGTGGFRYRFAKDNPIPSWGIGTADPHSQYWMMLSE
ncbi:MAG: O-antigen ligase family protein, partial [Legionella sp.]